MEVLPGCQGRTGEGRGRAAGDRVSWGHNGIWRTEACFQSDLITKVPLHPSQAWPPGLSWEPPRLDLWRVPKSPLSCAHGTGRRRWHGCPARRRSGHFPGRRGPGSQQPVPVLSLPPQALGGSCSLPGWACRAPQEAEWWQRRKDVWASKPVHRDIYFANKRARFFGDQMRDLGRGQTEPGPSEAPRMWPWPGHTALQDLRGQATGD